MKRDSFFDILKGIGIISIVVGHAFNTDNYGTEWMEVVRRFVYVYHLAIFFFVSGYFYRKLPLKIILKKQFLKSYIPYCLAQFLTLFFIPLFVWLKVIRPVPIELLFSYISRIIRFRGGGIFTEALWFVPTLVGIVILYTVLTKLTIKTTQFNKGIIVVLIGFLGIYLIEHRYLNFYHINKMFLFLPLFFLGDLFKNYRTEIMKRIKLSYFPLSMLLIFILNWVTGLQIEVSKGLVYGGIGFYPMAILGIVFCLAFAKFIETNNLLEKITTTAGKNSFSIMAFHFIIFKLMDGVYSFLRGGINETQLLRFPYSFVEFTFFYAFFGVLFPIVIAPIFNYILDRIVSSIQKVIPRLQV